MPLDLMQGLEDAGVLALTASSTNRRHVKALRRKPAKAPSVASSSMRSGMAHFRLKGAFLAGRRDTPNTPAPKWKVYNEGRMGKQQGHHHYSANLDYDQDHTRHHNCPRSLPVSARKLAASIWELQELPFSRGGDVRLRNSTQTHMCPDASDHASTHMHMHVRPASPASSLGSCFRLPMHSKQRRHVSSIERTRIGGGAPKAEIGSTPRNRVYGVETFSTKLDSCGAMTTNELVKVLNHLWSLEEHYARKTSLVAALQAELDQARSQLQELLLKEKAHAKEVECVTKQMVEERALWQEQHERSMRVTLSSMSQELENERKAKQKLEMLHKKGEKELRDMRRKLGKALQDLEKERKARELMEDVCDELAREVGEDKARVEELKRESVKVREEVEEERKMLQMAEVWREERVQMKLLEAKLELEEKNTVLDKLRGELETFLKAKRGNDAKEEASLSQHTYMHSLDASSGHSFADMSRFNTQMDLVSGRKSVDSVKQIAPRVYAGIHGSDDEDDLHSIELNNEAIPMSGNAQIGSHSSELHGFVQKGRKSVDQRASTMPTMHRQASSRFNDKSHGFEQLVAKDGKGEVGAEKEGLYDYAQVSQWIECSLEGGEMRDWGVDQEEPPQRGREECIKSWHRINGRPHELISCSPKTTAMKVNHQIESHRARASRSGPLNDGKESVFTRNQSDWLQRVYEFENVQSNSMLDNAYEGSRLMSSPTRQWAKP